MSPASAVEVLRWTATVLLLALSPVLNAAPADDSDIAVHVRQNGGLVIVDVVAPVKATAIETWNVITDYDNMAKFVSNLQLSKIIDRDGDTLTVAQKGKASRGLLTLAFENVREVVLAPHSEVHSRLISGDLQASEFTTRVVDHGDWAQIVNHGEFIPKIWIPPVIGPMLIESETRKQFQELRSEILRRKAQTSAGRQ